MPPPKSSAGSSPRQIGARIRAERERLGLTQHQMADALGVGRGSYAQLESWGNPRLDRLIELVELGMDIGAIAPELARGARR